MGPRRSHRKSRNGCPECKSRRLKCDERFPCTNCVKHAIQCSYVGPVRGTGTPTSSASPIPQSQPQYQSHVYRPSQEMTTGSISTPRGNFPWGITTTDIGLDSEDRWDLLEALPGKPGHVVQNAEDWSLDLELMHHFCSVTSNTMSWREDARHVWRVVIPMEGYVNKYVMHGLLAIAALHKAYLYSAQKTKYSKAAAHHLAVGLKEFRELVAAPIDSSNWQPVFCFASMISVHLSMVPVRLGVDCWPDPIYNMVELFASVKGFQEILRPFLRSLQKTQLAPLVNSIILEDDKLIPSPALVSQSLLPPGTWDQISRLHQLVDEYPFPQPHPPADSPTTEEDLDPRKNYKVAMTFFEISTRQIELAGPHLETGMVFMWAYPLSKHFHDDLKTYQPVALVILAHYCVLMQLVDKFWYIDGIGRQVLADIEKHLHPGFREWLVWPRRWVSGA
ncbi:hypothetical protein N7532_011750 [Penicillium argentinense]|uniref:Zn(2)-C6 fungal-type domain-containing protein n=1 Tax=Penicillium argentinense TaxID=1131581 RepID=A0A9W9EJ01_9EURO|nr:uncharacterized protein N7532_011750 [Penicillium argentinense]KAJ5082707.1 hypothetical protein N7532_011750 [Penicillium argentinense]